MRLSRKLLPLLAVLAPMTAFAQASPAGQGCSASENSGNALYNAGYRAYIRIDNTIADFSCNLTGTAYGNISMTSQTLTFTDGSSAQIGNLSIQTTARQYGYTAETSIGAKTTVSYGLTANLGANVLKHNFVFAFTGPVATTTYNYNSVNLAATIVNPAGLDPRIARTVDSATTRSAPGNDEDGKLVPSYVAAPANGVSNATPFDSARYNTLYAGNGNYNNRLNFIGNTACNTSTATGETQPPNACGFGSSVRTPSGALPNPGAYYPVTSLDRFTDVVAFSLSHGNWTGPTNCPDLEDPEDTRVCLYSSTNGLGATSAQQIQTSWSGGAELREVDPSPLEQFASPEPASFVFLGTGLLAIGGVIRRRRNASK